MSSLFKSDAFGKKTLIKIVMGAPCMGSTMNVSMEMGRESELQSQERATVTEIKALYSN